MAELRFDDKVVIVTGAGGGLGRAHALLFAERGARVLVNDLGGSMHGGGKNSKAADEVVAEIRQAGGNAEASYDSVEDGSKIVQAALDHFGRVDVVINNAGILRDVSFHKMSPADWDIIFRVHVNGSFQVSHAAWPHMRKQGYGRIVMTASAAGIYGNFGQANYGAAKLALLGFANTLAIEGRRRGIHVNTIAPIAGSRLTETVLPGELTEALKAEYVSPLVAWLCHEDCKESGGVFEVGGGFFSKLRWERSEGLSVRLGRKLSPELLQNRWHQVSGFEKSTHPDSITASMSEVMANVEAGPSRGGNELVDADLALGYEYPDMHSRYDERDLALYALGIGAAANPLDAKDLQLVYEMHNDGMTAFPTYAVIPAMKSLIGLAMEGHQAPGLNYGLDRLLHGEQYTEVLRPLPKKAKLTHRARIKDIWDKGKGAVIHTEAKTYDEQGELLAINEYVYFIRGAGNFGGDRGPSTKPNEAPNRAPDKVVEESIPANQALLYRLSGDVNPLHVDPSFAGMFGFDKPILHGLCTFGYAARHVVGQYAKDADARYFKSVRVRFAKSVFPGDTLVTEMWQEEGKIVFRCKVKERDEVVISHAAVELYDSIPTAPKKAAPAPSKQAQAATITSADVFDAIGSFLGSNADLVAKVGKVFQFELSSPASSYTVNAKDGHAAPGVDPNADCSLALSDHDFMDMCSGKADPMQLFSSGKLKISGDIMASQKLSFLKKLDPATVQAAANARSGSGQSTSAPAASKATSNDVFLGIKAYLQEHPELAERVKKVFVFQLSEPTSEWTLDVKNAGGSVNQGGCESADCTLAMSDADFMDMTSGKADPMKLFSSGKLKISGDIMASQKLSFLQKIDPEWARDAVAKLKKEPSDGGSTATPTETSAAASERTAVAPQVVASLETFIQENPGLATEVGATVVLRVSDPEATWTLQLGQGLDVQTGESAEWDVRLILSDSDLESLARGTAEAKKLYQHGKMRVDGDVNVLHRMGFLGTLLQEPA